HTLFEPFRQLVRRRQGQPCLAATTRAGQRQEAAILQQSLDLGQLLLPSDEAGELQRQVVGRTLRNARGGFRIGSPYGAKPPRVLRRLGAISFSLVPGAFITFSYSWLSVYLSCQRREGTRHLRTSQTSNMSGVKDQRPQ